jgi:mRNA-degrading endonuclease RelE of RelBE toxin-antitoxin system
MEVFVHHIPAKYIARLNEPDKSRLENAIDGLEKEPPEGDIRTISGQGGMFRLKAGGYRILFRYRENDILITHIDPRGQVYSKKNKGKKDDRNRFEKRTALDDRRHAGSIYPGDSPAGILHYGRIPGTGNRTGKP